MQPTTNATRYDPVTIAFHWGVAMLVALQWAGAQTIDWFPRGPLRTDARSVHIVLGLAFGALLVGRIIWRATSGRRLPAADQGALHVVAKATHWGLYALLAAMLAVGLVLEWARGDSIFGLFSIPALRPGDTALPHTLQDIHGLIAWAIIGLAGLHAGGALVHRYLWHDGVLARMTPWRGRTTP